MTVSQFLAEQRKSLTREQWQESYQSWAHGGNGWNRYGIGGTDINTALAWYQHLHRPGSKEWRPSIIMSAVMLHAEVNA
jgi:hypothetical protein